MNCCTIKCVGQGPIVRVDPEKLNFGSVKLLCEHTRKILLYNDSPIPAVVESSLVSAYVTLKLTHERFFLFQSQRSPFDLTDEQVVEIEPQSCYVLSVTVYLKNPGKVTDRLTLRLLDGSDITCKVEARGYGTSIMCEPVLHPEINMGTVLTHREVALSFKFTNMGRKPHKLLWSRNKSLKRFKHNPEFEIPYVFYLKPSQVVRKSVLDPISKLCQ